jgi:hypothetical protein
MKKLCVSMTLVVVSLGLVGTPAYAAPSGTASSVSVPSGSAVTQTLCWIWPRHCL